MKKTYKNTKYLQIILLLICFSSIALFANGNSRAQSNAFLKGETLNYRARWGILTVGHAQTIIEPKVYLVQSHPCYKIDVVGHTNGLASAFYVKDRWSAYIDTTTLITHRSSRSIREGRYVMDEMVNFDHKNKKVAVWKFDQSQKKYVTPKFYDTPENVCDLIAGFMLIRIMDFSKKTKYDTITINGFLEDTSYQMNILYIGKENIKTDRGVVRCLLLRPIMPENKLLNGKNSVEVWISDDENQTLMRIRAKMFVGTFNIELES